MDRWAKNQEELKDGVFFLDAGGSFDQRCLTGKEEEYNYKENFEVAFPMLVIESEVAPGGFGKKGGGKQFLVLNLFNGNVNDMDKLPLMTAKKLRDIQKYYKKKVK